MKKHLILFSMLLVSCLAFTQNSRTVTGKIIESITGEPVIGATVSIKGQAIGTITSTDGDYSLENVLGNSTLVFKTVGMKTVEVPVNNRTTINVELEDDNLLLDEVVVVGYGTVKKRDLTGSIASVAGTEIANKPSLNPLTSLQGKIAGVQVVNTGRAGQDPEIRIRGTNSINGYTPLYVVDGLFTDNINYLNPADIESIEILKDPSSLAIFGIRGANGVIILSTKRAKEGQTVVNVNSSIGWKHISDRLPLTNAAEFKELYNEQLINQKASPFDYTHWQADTDWQDEIFQTGFLNNNNISITGSSGKNKFYLGIGYTTEEGSIKSEKLSKFTINLNSEYQVNNHLRFGYQVNGSRTLPPDAKGVESVIKAVPIAPTHFDYTDPITGVTERLVHSLPDFQRAQAANPYRAVELQGRHNLGKNHRVAGNIFGEAKFLKNFTFKSTFSINFTSNESRNFSPIIFEYNPDIVGASQKEALGNKTETVGQSKSTYWTGQQDHILTYENKFGNHGLTGMLGFTSNYIESSSLGGNRSQKLEDIYFSPGDNTDKWWLSSLSSTAAATNSGSQWKRFSMSYLARALYNYNNRYLLNGSFRRDGSSVFSGVGNTWDNFYSLGAAWIVSEEKFMANQNIVDHLKIKGSWGVLGSENTGGNNYPSYPTLTSAGSAVFGDDIIPGYTMQYLVQDLRWEKTYSWEAGFEANFLDQRLSIESVYYNKRTEDIIVSLSSRTGAQNSLENLGEITNKGIELSATWSDKLANGDFRYSIGANLTTIKNNVETLGRDEGDAKYSGSSRTMAGHPIAHFYGYEVIGVYQNEEDIYQSPVNTVVAVAPGDLKFKDVDGDGKITTYDRTMIGNPTPDLTYGFNINLAYKGIDLTVDMMGVYGNEVYRNWGNASTYAQLNYRKDHMNRWHGEGTSNWEPILDPSRAVNNLASSYFVEDGSFFRIRNIQLGYTFDKSLLSKLYLKSLRVYANVQNLKTWHKNSGYTPEVGGSALAFGIDSGGYPMPAIYTFGINLSF
ncbi:TonB-dependent receptor [Bacteroides sp. 51]|uniref:SusC/RagA family TonB-linked outer membrane protein n=1 Tax=Bacteroides sp. 51 TaxID=2302938 RepID=UPI0013D22533|nr:TonB-dependent receptor [Bacteroides sp. 51]NDV82084.1 TonB-dependent receptor [Bacteroides sp. 51]